MLPSANASVEIERIERLHRFQPQDRKSAYEESGILVAAIMLSKVELLNQNRRAPVCEVLVTGRRKRRHPNRSAGKGAYAHTNSMMQSQFPAAVYCGDLSSAQEITRLEVKIFNACLQCRQMLKILTSRKRPE